MKAQIPFTAWEPTRQNYVQFLVDSLLVYETLEGQSGTASILYFANFKYVGQRKYVGRQMQVFI